MQTEVQAYAEALEERLADTLKEPQDEKQGAGSSKEEKYDSKVMWMPSRTPMLPKFMRCTAK